MGRQKTLVFQSIGRFKHTLLHLEIKLARQNETKFFSEWRQDPFYYSDLILWQPRHGTNCVGRRRHTFVKKTALDTGLHQEILATAMADRDGWRDRVKTIRASRLPWENRALSILLRFVCINNIRLQPWQIEKRKHRLHSLIGVNCSSQIFICEDRADWI